MKKTLKGKDAADPGQATELIKTWRKVGYLLDVKRELTCILA